MRKVEHYSVQKVTGDGRCMFRALVSSVLALYLQLALDLFKHRKFLQHVSSCGATLSCHALIYHDITVESTLLKSLANKGFPSTLKEVAHRVNTKFNSS